MLTVWYFMMGSMFGSFAGVVSSRIPRGEGLGGRSRCACGRKLLWWENVPIIGYISARGSARCCGEPIGLSTLLTELAYGTGVVAGMLIAGALGAVVTLALMLSFTFLSAYMAEEETPGE